MNRLHTVKKPDLQLISTYRVMIHWDVAIYRSVLQCCTAAWWGTSCILIWCSSGVWSANGIICNYHSSNVIFVKYSYVLESRKSELKKAWKSVHSAISPHPWRFGTCTALYKQENCHKKVLRSKVFRLKPVHLWELRRISCTLDSQTPMFSKYAYIQHYNDSTRWSLKTCNTCMHAASAVLMRFIYYRLDRLLMICISLAHLTAQCHQATSIETGPGVRKHCT